MPKSLITQSKSFNCVINIPHEKYTKDMIHYSLKTYLDSISDEYYFIFHDKDKTSDGVLKTKHFHVLYHLSAVGKKRIGTAINDLCDNLFNGNEKLKNCIQVTTWTNHDLDIQYLIHKNDSDKYKYNIKEVITNSKELLEQVLDYDIGMPFDIPYLKALCVKHIDDTFGFLNVLEEIGLSRANLYMRVIKVVWDYVVINQSKILEEMKKKQYIGDDLPF